jgi:hypothetical protein
MYIPSKCKEMQVKQMQVSLKYRNTLIYILIPLRLMHRLLTYIEIYCDITIKIPLKFIATSFIYWKYIEIPLITNKYHQNQ